MPAKMTKAQKAQYDRLFQTMQSLVYDFQTPALVGKYLPADWSHIPTSEVADKVRLTLRVDADVARFYRKLGPQYQATMNRVLRSFMLARLTELLAQDDRIAEADDTDEIAQLQRAREVELVTQLDALRRARFGKDWGA